MYTDINELDRWNQPDEGDPLIMLRKHREELSKKYPTIKELGDYYSRFRSCESAQIVIATRCTGTPPSDNGQ